LNDNLITKSSPMKVRALFQQTNDSGRVRCTLCPHSCILEEGKSGICRTRINIKGILHTLAYGNPCSIAIDPVEKKPLFHFLPGSDILSIATAGCNLRCQNCQNWTISQIPPTESQNYRISPDEIVELVLERSAGYNTDNGDGRVVKGKEKRDPENDKEGEIKNKAVSNTKSIAFTYTEPTVYYEYMLDVAKAAKERGVKCVIVSNGYINEGPLKELCPYLDAANIDLKCFDPLLHKKLTGGRLEPVLESLGILKDSGVWLEITNLLIPGWSDDMMVFEKMCDWLIDNGFADTPLHLSRFFPNYKLQLLSPTPESVITKAAKRARERGMKYVYTGNLCFGREENSICPKCGYLLVERSRYFLQSIQIRKEINGKSICPECGEVIPGIWF